MKRHQRLKIIFTVFSSIWLVQVAPSAAQRPDPPIDPAAIDSCLFGRIDNFLDDGPEPAQPSSWLLGSLEAYTSRTLLGFDQCGTDRYFGHTVTTCLGTDSSSVTITIRLKAIGGNPRTDILYLGAYGLVGWGLRMNSLVPDFSWDVGDTVTVILDLDNLPPSDMAPSYGPFYPTNVTSIREQVRQRGDLDVAVADDTCVDFIAVRADPGVTAVRPMSWGRVKEHYR
jgi:hypothetical protein